VGSDNVTIPPASGGPVIAADDIAGVKVQRVKIGSGADGAYTDVSDTAPLPTQLLPGSTVGSDRAVVNNPGTAVRLPSHPNIYGLTVRALLGNTGLIFFGGPTVTLLSGFQLAPGETISVDVADPAAAYIDAELSGDGVCMTWVSP
jgi:hypothetical protein